MSSSAIIRQRLAALREVMQQTEIDIYVVPTADPHNNEYVADHWKGREWLSGFTGSAGTLVVTSSKAALWTDSRYFLQAEQELKDTGISLMRMGEAQVPTINQWLLTEFGLKLGEDGDVIFGAFTQEKCIGVDLKCISIEGYNNMFLHLWDFVADVDLLHKIWSDRPGFPANPIEEQPLEWAGSSREEKIARLRKLLNEDRRYYYVITDISEIAWLLNLRGSDIAYNPLFLSYLVVGIDRVTLFVGKDVLDKDLLLTFEKEGIEIRPYEEGEAFIYDLLGSHQRGMYSNTISAAYHEYAAERESLDSAEPMWKVMNAPITAWRAEKNEAEVAGFHRAMRLDGAALVRFHRELDEKIAAGTIADETEWSIGERLTAIRAEHPEFRGLSFATIAGYGANGAIVHYEATQEAHAKLEGKSFLLLDSGAHYVSGTTDITRTIPLGALTDEERKAYTLVLKGMIQLTLAHFPEGTTGQVLDFAARQPMWREGYDFGHGTGHGVGSRLCVHEGPQQIRKDRRDATEVPFKAGMTVSNEPGIYEAGQFGVRLENILLTVPAQSTDFGRFLRFETLTLCPFDRSPIIVEMLEPSERAWLDAYHAMVREELLPFLEDEADKLWLEQATQPL